MIFDRILRRRPDSDGPAPHVFAGAAALFALLLSGVVVLQLADDRREVVELAYRDVENLSDALAEHTRQTLAGIALALAGLSEGDMATVPANVGAAQDRHRALASAQAISPATFAYFVLDARGILVASSRMPTPEPVDFSGYPEFLSHRDRTDAGLVIGPPRLGRVGLAKGRWIFNASRRLETPDGQFAGVMAAAISIDHLLEFYSTIRTGPDGVVGLLNPDGIIIARSPLVERYQGQDVSGTDLFAGTMASAVSGRFRVRFLTDGVERFGAFRRVAEGRGIVYVGMGVADVLSGWRRRAVFEGVGAVFAIGLFSVAAWGMWSHLVRRHAWERARSERLRALAAASAEIARQSETAVLLSRAADLARTLFGARSAMASLTGLEPRVAEDVLEADRMVVSMRAADGRPIGVIELAGKLDGAFSSDDLNELRQLASVAGAALEHLRALDARERALALAQAARSELETVFTSISDAVYVLDKDWRFTYLNPEAGRLLERDPAELLGRVVWEAFPEAVDTELHRTYHAAVSVGEPRSLEFLYPPLSRWFSVRAYPHAAGLTVYFLDITRRVDIEERLRQAQKMEAIGQLTGGIAHDFNNLLTVILGNADLLVGSLDGAPASVRAQVDGIRQAGERAATLINRLLAFARKQPLDPRTVDLNELVDEVEGLLRRTLGERIDIEKVRGTGLWKAAVDPHELQNALLNLAINARDAMPGGGKLTIETSNVSVDDDYARAQQMRAGQFVMLAVSDSGEGMTPEVLARAFEPYFTTKPPGKGSGMGLPQVYGFARQSGGHARIYSEPGEGTTVKLYLPRGFGDARPAKPLEDPLPEARSRERILVVEDDELVRRHTVALLDVLGYEVRSADRGSAALTRIDSGERYDLLLTDVVLPGGLSGRQVADEAMRRQPSLKVLYMSGYTENAIVHQGRLDPGVQLLSKPFRVTDLARKVREALGGAPRAEGIVRGRVE